MEFGSILKFNGKSLSLIGNGTEWNLKPGVDADGDSLSYQDMMERQMLEEKRRQREKAIMEEGRALWQNKRREELEREIRDVEEVSLKLFRNVLRCLRLSPKYCAYMKIGENCVCNPKLVLNL